MTAETHKALCVSVIFTSVLQPLNRPGIPLTMTRMDFSVATQVRVPTDTAKSAGPPHKSTRLPPSGCAAGMGIATYAILSGVLWIHIQMTVWWEEFQREASMKLNFHNAAANKGT